MTPSTQITKFMCTVETKNYPVNSIRPIIHRYNSIRKKLTVSEIASCLSVYASVTLHKENGANVKLNLKNYKQILLDYKNELLASIATKNMNSEAKKNSEALEKIKAEEAPKAAPKKSAPAPKAVVEEVKEKEPEEVEQGLTDTESMEVAQEDPEHPDADWSHIYGDEEEKENEE